MLRRNPLLANGGGSGSRSGTTAYRQQADSGAGRIRAGRSGTARLKPEPQFAFTPVLWRGFSCAIRQPSRESMKGQGDGRGVKPLGNRAFGSCFCRGGSYTNLLLASRSAYETAADISARYLAGTGCPKCAATYAKVHYNLRTENPLLVQEWHPRKNTISPDEVTPGSHKKVWWVCHECGHEWKTEVRIRNRGSGCPKCSRKRTG